MFKRTIKLDVSSDAARLVEDLRDDAARSGLDPADVEALGRDAAAVIVPLLENVVALSRRGSQIEAVRHLKGRGYAVEIRVGNSKRGLLPFFRRLIGGR